MTRIAFPLQQWLHKCTSVLCYAYITCLVITSTNLRVCAYASCMYLCLMLLSF